MSWGHKLSTPKEQRDPRKSTSGPTKKYTFQIKNVGPDILLHGSCRLLLVCLTCAPRAQVKKTLILNNENSHLIIYDENISHVIAEQALPQGLACHLTL